MYIGQTKLILRYLGFLKEEYGFEFAFQTFDSYNDFLGPIDTYSFYNSYGCFTLHNIVQRGEWEWYISSSFSTNQYKLLEKKIDPNLYISTHCWLLRTVLKRLAESLKTQIMTTGFVFDIKV